MGLHKYIKCVVFCSLFVFATSGFAEQSMYSVKVTLDKIECTTNPTIFTNFLSAQNAYLNVSHAEFKNTYDLQPIDIDNSISYSGTISRFSSYLPIYYFPKPEIYNHTFCGISNRSGYVLNLSGTVYLKPTVFTSQYSTTWNTSTIHFDNYGYDGTTRDEYAYAYTTYYNGKTKVQLTYKLYLKVTLDKVYTLNLGPDISLCGVNGVTLKTNETWPSGTTFKWTKGSDPQILGTGSQFTATVAGTYKVEVTNGTCTLVDEIVILPGSGTNINLGPDISKCENEDITLKSGLTTNANSVVEWTWKPNGLGFPTPLQIQGNPVEISVRDAGVYTVKVKTGNCTVTDNITVTNKPAPHPYFSQSIYYTNPGTPVFLEPLGAVYSHNYWLQYNRVDEPIFTAYQPGVYTVEVENADGCKNQAYTRVLLNKDNTLTVYNGIGGEAYTQKIEFPDLALPIPNPNTNHLNIKDEQTYNPLDIVQYAGVVRLNYHRNNHSDVYDKFRQFTKVYAQYTMSFPSDPSRSPIDGELIVSVDKAEPVYQSINAYDGSKEIDLVVTEVGTIDASGVRTVNDLTALGMVDITDFNIELVQKINFLPYIEKAEAVEDCSNNSINTLDNRNLFTWQHQHGAYSYELQFAFRDSKTQGYGTSLSASAIDKLFQENGYSVNTTNNYYVLDITYPEGQLYWRVRGIGKHNREVNTPISVATWSETQILQNSTGFSSTHNWEKTVSFAEDGKKKEVVNYYDNTLKSQQVVTNLNSEKLSLYAESYVDNEGRAVTNVLPTPLNDINGLNYESINKNMSGTQYSKMDFDYGVQRPFSTSSGASQYYSSLNPLRGVYRKADLNQLPNANGYVSTQTVYTNDNTGRIAIQSGVGETFAIDGNNPSRHVTRYFYGTPNATELQRMFGSNVGLSKHYQKNMVVDPNGQASISYIDMYGKTIATCLSGKNPDNLEPLASLNLDRIPQSMDDNNIQDKDNFISTNTSTILNTIASNPYDFVYNVKGLFNKGNLFDDNFCKACVYELEIDITDPDGKKVDLTGYNSSIASYDAITKTLHVDNIKPNSSLPVPDINASDAGCPNSYTFPDVAFSALFVPLGNYVVNKTLKLKEGMVENILYGENTASTTDDFPAIPIKETVPDLSTMNCCEINCLLMMGLTKVPQYDPTNPDDEVYTEYQKCIQTCNKLHEPTIDEAQAAEDECDALLKKIIMQIRPNGYFFEQDNNFLPTCIPLLNGYIYHQGEPDEKDYTDLYNQLVGKTLTEQRDILSVNFDEPIELLFATKHREYNAFAVCKELEPSTIYDYKMALTENWTEAKAKGYLTNVANSSAPHPYATSGTATPFIDPFIDIAYGGDQSKLVPFMQMEVPVDDVNKTTLPFWEIVNPFLTSTPGVPYMTNIYYNRKNLTNPSVNASDDNYKLWDDANDISAPNHAAEVARLDQLMWQNYLSLYIGEKTKHITKWKTDERGIIYYPDANAILKDPTVPQDHLALTAYNNAQMGQVCVGICHGNALSWMSQMAAICPDLKVAYEEYVQEQDEQVTTHGSNWTKINALISVLEQKCNQTCNANNPLAQLSPAQVSSILADPAFTALSGTCTVDFTPVFANGPNPGTNPNNNGVTYTTMPVQTCADNNCMGDFVKYVVDHYVQGVPITGTTITSAFPDCDFGAVIQSVSIVDGEIVITVVKTPDPPTTCDIKLKFADSKGNWIDIPEVLENPEKGSKGFGMDNQIDDYTYSGWRFLTDYSVLFQFPGGTTSGSSTERVASNIYNGWTYDTADTLAIDSIAQYYMSIDTLYYILNTRDSIYDWKKDDSAGYYSLFEVNDKLYMALAKFSNDTFITQYYYSNDDSYISQSLRRGAPIADGGDENGGPPPSGPCPTHCKDMPNMLYDVNCSDCPESGRCKFYRIICVSGVPTTVYCGCPGLDNSPQCQSCNNPVQSDFANIYMYMDVPEGCNSPFQKCTTKNIITGIACTPAVCPPDEIIIPDENEDCRKQAIPILQGIIDGRFDTKIDEAKTDLLQTLNKCFEGLEEHFKYTSALGNYHYTLYYYDQANNLVQTVPPEGVELIPITSTYFDGNANLIGTVYPDHRVKTTYQFNSRNQVISQHTPDAKDSKFFYNRKGQLRISQNAQQSVDNKFSFTIYDAQGRIQYVGEYTTTDPWATVIQNAEKDLKYPYNLDPNSTYFVADNIMACSQITETVYDNQRFVPDRPERHNLRSRVAETYYYDNFDSYSDGNFAASLYDYDEIGNVKRIHQLSYTNMGSNQRWYVMDYDYDLVSGKVNKVAMYNGVPDADDQPVFYHRYEYDSDNRITAVYSSKDGMIEDCDARYFYYPHGPLARVELGHDEVQGTDYAYTLQGWLKYMNKPDAYASNNPGTLDVLHNFTSHNDYSVLLGYYNGEYKDINYNNSFSQNVYSAFPSASNIHGRDLFNGNIAFMATMIGKAVNDENIVNQTPLEDMPYLGTQVMAYDYDQLNRLVKTKTYGFNPNNNAALSVTGYYDENYSYDANGNIKTLDRKALFFNGISLNAQMMDNFIYHPDLDMNGNIKNNRLMSLQDQQSDKFSPDIKQGNHPYDYDDIGNLVGDADESIQKIEWNVYNKIKSIQYVPNSGKDDLEFMYDASGNRIAKISKPDPSPSTWTFTWYVRDAQGNILLTETDGPYSTTPHISKEYMLYGSSRLGMYKSDNEDEAQLHAATYGQYTRLLTKKDYELNNHLGNVLETVDDMQKGVPDNTGETVDYYTASLTTAQDYYPFGMMMPKRSYVPPRPHCFRYDIVYSDDFTTCTDSDDGDEFTCDRWYSLFAKNTQPSFMMNWGTLQRSSDDKMYLYGLDTLQIDGAPDIIGARDMAVEPGKRYNVSLDVSELKQGSRLSVMIASKAVVQNLNSFDSAVLAYTYTNTDTTLNVSFVANSDTAMLLLMASSNQESSPDNLSSELKIDNVELTSADTTNQHAIYTSDFSAGTDAWNSIFPKADETFFPSGFGNIYTFPFGSNTIDSGKLRTDMIRGDSLRALFEDTSSTVPFLIGVTARDYSVEAGKNYRYSFESESFGSTDTLANFEGGDSAFFASHVWGMIFIVDSDSLRMSDGTLERGTLAKTFSFYNNNLSPVNYLDFKATSESVTVLFFETSPDTVLASTYLDRAELQLKTPLLQPGMDTVESYNFATDPEGRFYYVYQDLDSNIITAPVHWNDTSQLLELSYASLALDPYPVAQVSRKFLTQAGHRYVVSFDIAGDSLNQYATVSIGGTNLITDDDIAPWHVRKHFSDMGSKQYYFQSTGDTARFGMTISLNDTSDVYTLDNFLVKEIDSFSLSTVELETFDSSAGSWRNSFLPSDTTHYLANETGKFNWIPEIPAVRINTRSTLNPEVPAVGIFQKSFAVSAGNHYEASVRVRSHSDNLLFGVCFAVNKDMLDSLGIEAVDEPLGGINFLADSIFKVPFIADRTGDVTLMIGAVGASPNGFMVVDSISLMVSAQDTIWTDTFEDTIAPWRNHVLELDTLPLQAGILNYDTSAHKLKVTQVALQLPTDNVGTMDIWAGIAAIDLKVNPAKRYRLTFDVIDADDNPIDMTASLAGVNIAKTRDLQAANVFSVTDLTQQEFFEAGTVSTSSFRSYDDTSITAFVYVATPQQGEASFTGGSSTTSPGNYYIDNIKLEEVTEITCGTGNPLPISDANGYRYGFNSKEKFDEICGEGNTLDLGARIYSPRLGKQFSPDPKENDYPWQSTYAYYGNSPIWQLDYNGEGGWTRVFGALRAVGGAIQVVGGVGLLAAPEPTGLTKVGGVVAVGHGADDFQTGFRELLTGEKKESLTFKGIKKTVTLTGASENTAIKVATFSDIALSFVGGGTGGLSLWGKFTKAEISTYSKIGSTGVVGEDALKLLGGEQHAFFRTTKGSRYVDQLVNGVAHESKVGYTSLTDFVKSQIAKDVELMKTEQISEAVWHFFKSPVTGKTGASKPLLKALEDSGIKVVIH